MKILNAKIEESDNGRGDCLIIHLYAFDMKKPIGEIELQPMTDENEKVLQYLLTWKDADFDDPMILREGHKDEGIIQYAENPRVTQTARKE